MKRKSCSPKEARSHKDMCRLQSDNRNTKHGWILLDVGKVILTNQIEGEAHTGQVEFSRAEFNRLIDWYLKPQSIRTE